MSNACSEPKALPSVRRALLRWLEDAGATQDEAYAVQVACHEACTNAIEHGYRFYSYGDAMLIL